MAQSRFYGTMPLDGVFTKFGAGVDFFFVLSGFIISWAHWSDIGRRERLGRYAVRRFRRIYPPYWGVLIPLSLAYFLMPSAGEPSQHDPLNFVFSFFLLPYPEHPILGVAWTLVFEMIFYLVFAGLIVWGRMAFVGLAAWAALVLIANIAFPPAAFPLSFLTDVHNVEFLIGIAATALLRRFNIPQPRLLAVAGVVLFVAQMLVHAPVLDDPLVGRLGYGLAAALAMVGIVEWERSHALTVPAIFREMGAASYAIYLVHGVVLSFGLQVLIRVLPRSIPLPLVLATLTVASILGGITYHHFVEKPLARWMSGWRSRRTPGGAAAIEESSHVG